MAILYTIRDEIYRQTFGIYEFVVKSVPNILIALGIIIIGYFVATFFGFVTRKILYHLNLDKRLRKEDLKDSLGHISIANFFGKIVKWVLFIVFFTQGLSYLTFGIFSEVLNNIVLWLPKLVFSILIIVFGWIFIDFITYKILEMRWKYTRFTVKTIKIALVVIIFITALDQIGIELTFLKSLFLITFAAFALATSLVIGISLGFGLKDDAKKFIKEVKKK